MPQIVGVFAHIDCCDLSVLDFERGRLELTIGFQRDETGQTVDETDTNELRDTLVEPPEQRHDGIEPQVRLRGCRTLAATVGMKADISRQQRAKTWALPPDMIALLDRVAARAAAARARARDARQSASVSRAYLTIGTSAKRGSAARHAATGRPSSLRTILVPCTSATVL